MPQSPPATGPRLLEAIGALDTRLTSIDRLLARLAAPNTTSNPDLLHRLQAVEAAIRELKESIDARRRLAFKSKTRSSSSRVFAASARGNRRVREHAPMANEATQPHARSHGVPLARGPKAPEMPPGRRADRAGVLIR